MHECKDEYGVWVCMWVWVYVGRCGSVGVLPLALAGLCKECSPAAQCGHCQLLFGDSHHCGTVADQNETPRVPVLQERP